MKFKLHLQRTTTVKYIGSSITFTTEQRAKKQCSSELLQYMSVLVLDLDLAECIHRLLQMSSPTVVLDLYFFPGVNDVHLLQAIFNMTYLPDKVVWLNRCL